MRVKVKIKVKVKVNVKVKVTVKVKVKVNIKVKVHRDSEETDTGAELGIGPWKLGMLAAKVVLTGAGVRLHTSVRACIVGHDGETPHDAGNGAGAEGILQGGGATAVSKAASRFEIQ